MKKYWLFALVILGLGLGSLVGFVVIRELRGGRQNSTDSDAGTSLVLDVDQAAQEGESGRESHRDFPIRNPSDKPLAVQLLRTDCTCLHLRIAVAPESWQQLDAKEIRRRADDKNLKWQEAIRGGASIELPPKAVALARLSWKAEMEGDHAFRADVRVNDGQGDAFQRMEVLARLIEPVRVRVDGALDKKEVDIGRLNPGGERKVSLLCYSPTREKFTLTADPPEDDPCVVYGDPQLVPKEELKELTKKAGIAVRSAYRVPVTVREQAGGKRLDLGTIRRRLLWKTNVFPGHKAGTYVNGFVMGEVSLVDPQGRTFIDMGEFQPRKDPPPIEIQLRSSDPRIELSLDRDKTIEFLTVDLLDGKEGKPSDGGKVWRVRVGFSTDTSFRGLFPNPERPNFDTAVRCSIVFIVSRPGSPPRRLFIPVRGDAKAI